MAEKISPRAKKKAAALGIRLDDIVITGTGFDGGICEKDIIEYSHHINLSPKISITPLAKKIAEMDQIDLSQIKGSGIGGKITKADVIEIHGASAPELDPGQNSAFFHGKEILEEIPYTGIRKIIGDRLSESKFTAPHLYFTQKINVEKLLAIRKEINEMQEQKTSVTDYIAKACILALQKYPDMNSSLIDGKLIKYKTVNLGIAVAADSGLIVPVIKHSEKMGILEVAGTSSGLFDKARQGKLTPDEYTGGTFTISNLGMFGIENFTAIINPPEVAILAVSSVKDEPIVAVNPDGSKTVEIAPMMNVQLSVDHRVVDGLLAAQFTAEIKNLLEKPLQLMV